VEVSPTKQLTLFLSETPQEVRKLHPEFGAELSQQREE
jgi:hypothetical protein